MAREQDREENYRSAATEYAEASSRYELAVMSGDRAERAAAQHALEGAGERYAQAMAATVDAAGRLRLEDALAQPWAQHERTSQILASIVAYEAAQPAAAGAGVRAFASQASSVVTQPWTSLAGRLIGATGGTGALPLTAYA